VITRADALALDAADPLAPRRAHYVVDDSVIYLDGNSLGRLPRATVGVLREAVEQQWGQALVRAWPGWIDLPSRVGDLIAVNLLGARPAEVVLCDSTTVNLYKLAHAALHAQPGRRVIVVAEDEFPTDRYVLAGLAASCGAELRVVGCDPDDGPALEALEAALDQDVALVCLSLVGYRSGALLDLPAVTRLVHAAGALVLWDLSHAAGAVPIDLQDGGADLAVGCTYKYLNGGPGSPAFLYVRRELQERLGNPIQGWFGQYDQFAMGLAHVPRAGVARFLTGTPSVLGTLAVEQGVRGLAEAGLPALRAKGMALTALLVDLVEQAGLLDPDAGGFALASPRDPARRGSHVCLQHPQAWQICQALLERGVVADFRVPVRLRLGPAPAYTRHVEVWDAVDRLREVMAARSYDAHPSAVGAVT
jgi:kynureninase